MKEISPMHTQSLWHWWPFRLFRSRSEKSRRRRMTPAAICRSIREPSHCLGPAWISVWSLANSLNKEVLGAALIRDNPAVTWAWRLQRTGFHIKKFIFIEYWIFNETSASLYSYKGCWTLYQPSTKTVPWTSVVSLSVRFYVDITSLKICHGSSNIKPAVFFRESSVRTV